MNTAEILFKVGEDKERYRKALIAIVDKLNYAKTLAYNKHASRPYYDKVKDALIIAKSALSET